MVASFSGRSFFCGVAGSGLEWNVDENIWRGSSSGRNGSISERNGMENAKRNEFYGLVTGPFYGRFIVGKMLMKTLDRRVVVAVHAEMNRSNEMEKS